MNSIFLLNIRKSQPSNLWVFDDPVRGLINEPFLDDASRFIDSIAEHIRVSRNQSHDLDVLGLAFCGEWFENATHSVERVEDVDDVTQTGVYYRSGEHTFWLCPATAKYFPKPPEKIWFKVYG